MDKVLDPALVLYLPLYRLNGGAFASLDGLGHRCPATGGETRPQGRWFDGMDDLLVVPDHPALNFGGAGDFTIMVWFNEHLTLSDGFLLAKRNTDTGDIRLTLLLSNSSGLLVFNIKDGTSSLPPLGTRIPVHNDSQWHCVIVACDRDNAEGAALDLDGDVQAAVDPTSVGDISTPGRDLVIGASYSAGWFRNLIGEVAVWGRALPFPERQRLYHLTRDRYC